MALRDNRVPLEILELPVRRVDQDLKDLPGRPVLNPRKAQLDFLDPLEPLVSLELQDRQGALASPAQLELPEWRVFPAHKVQPDNLDRLEAQDFQDRLGLAEHQDCLESLAHPDLQDPLEHLDSAACPEASA